VVVVARIPSGVWKTLALPNSSLVGLAFGGPPGRGEPRAKAEPLAAGPID
jgi:hypothetical protein